MNAQPFENETAPPDGASEGLSTLTRAEIDIQITTARKYPRVLSQVKAEMLSFATLDEETAQSCFYTLKRKDRNGAEKLIQGPSIRLGEIALSCYGNIKAGARIISNDGKSLVAQGICHDLQKNVTVDMQTTRRITGKDGRTFSDDMQVVTGNAACAIALRNAIFKVVPLALIKPVYEEARRVAVGDVKSLAAKREKVMARLKSMGASQDNILAAVDARKIDDIDLAKLEILIGLGTALKDGETTLEEAFPAPAREAEEAEEPEAKPELKRKPDLKPESKAPADKPGKTAPERLAELLETEHYSFPELVEWAVGTGNLDNPVSSINEIPDKLCETWLKAKRGLLLGLAQLRKESSE